MRETTVYPQDQKDHSELDLTLKFTQSSFYRPYSSSRKMRQWRYDHQGNLWTRGSRVRCCGRFFCCTIMIAVFLIVSIILSMALVSPVLTITMIINRLRGLLYQWIRPPNVVIGNPVLSTNGSAVCLQIFYLRSQMSHFCL